MNCKKRVILRSLGLSLSLIAGSVFCVPTPSTAHVINQDVLSIQLKQEKEKYIEINSNLLIEGGQKIVIGEDFTEKTIPITVSFQNCDFDDDELLMGNISAVSSNENRMQVFLDKETLIIDGTEQTINLTIQLLTEQTPESGDDMEGDQTPEAGGESGTEETPEAGEETGSENTPENGGETGNENVPQNGEETEGEPENEGTPENGEETGNDSIPEQGTDEIQMQVLETIFTGTAIEEETEITTESEDIEESLYVNVNMKVGEQNFSADIVIHENVQKTDAQESSLEFCPSQYHPTEPVKLISGAQADCTLYGFPVMTRYTVEDVSYLLYDEEAITLPAGKEAEFDFSKTELKSDIIVTTDSGISYTMKYMELPKFSNENALLIVAEEGINLDVTKTWGTIEPNIFIENLNVAGESVAWQEADGSVTAAYKEDGMLQILPDGAEAGTYRATISWIENDITLYKIMIPFFIQYQSGSWGGTGQ